MELHPIKTEQDYNAALRAIETLWTAPVGSPEAEQLEILVTLVEAYEATHHPIDPPDPIDAIKFRMEQGAKVSRTSSVSRPSCCGRARPQAPAHPGDAPALASGTGHRGGRPAPVTARPCAVVPPRGDQRSGCVPPLTYPSGAAAAGRRSSSLPGSGHQSGPARPAPGRCRRHRASRHYR